MNKLIIEHVRCFRSLQEVPIKPLTLLVGENSTGKSTFLAAVRVANALGTLQQQIDFNEPPFTLGAYDQIASYAGGKGGRAKTFRIGYELTVPSSPGEITKIEPPLRLTGTFASVSGQPRMSELLLESGDDQILMLAGRDDDLLRLEISTRDKKFPVTLKWPGGPTSFPNIPMVLFMLTHFESLRDGAGQPILATQEAKTAIERLNNLLRTKQVVSDAACFASAPIRMKPERTYDPETDIPRPEGNHIPMVMAQMALNNPEKWSTVKSALTRFGTATGLFVDVIVKRLGNQISNPFQLKFKVSGPADNLIDVGYGISQVLPILVEVLISDVNKLFLLQQPEVHLHPRAQAELGTFLGEIAAKRKIRFLVETHSDYLIDRICMDVRDGKTGLRAEDVAILYFERKNRWVKVYPISVDKNGNVQNAPKTYRAFFLQEDAQLFGR